MNITRVALDLAKQVIQLHAVDSREKVIKRVALKRDKLLEFFVNLPPCQVGMEACSGSHDWARRLQAMGHTARLMPPNRVKPYVHGQKNDRNDAAAICEAMARPTMHFVPVKSVDQQERQALIRIRSERVASRTSLVNQIRGLLAEFGIVLAQNISAVRCGIPQILEDAQNGLSARFRRLLAGLYDDLTTLDRRITDFDREITNTVAQDEALQRLRTIPGIGPITAVALAASVGDARSFKSGRQMAAFFGLTPKQHSSGGKTRLLGMHKRGDSYLRGLLVHGARAVQRTAAKHDTAHSRWLDAIAQRRHRNVATVAQANKTVRIAWAVMTRGEVYRAPN